MMQIVEQTHEQKVAMYNKFEKEELIAMLIQANKHLDALSNNKPNIYLTPNPIEQNPYINTPAQPFIPPFYPTVCNSNTVCDHFAGNTVRTYNKVN